MRIERLSPDDWERSRDVRLRALLDAPDAFATRHAEEREQPEPFWRGRLENAACATFVARAGGVDLGCAVGAPWTEAASTAGLFSMWVAPEARGQGAGDALVRAVVDWAREGGYARLVLEVADENAPAVGLYARHGFEPTGRTGHLPAPREHVLEHERALVLEEPSA